MAADEIKAIWNRIKNACTEHCPGLQFNPPASEDAIKNLEEQLGMYLPEEFKTSIRIHNGMPVFPTGELLSTERVYDRWKMWTDLLNEGVFDEVVIYIPKRDGKVKEGCWWSRKWIPLVNDGCGNDECLDFDPGETGIEGQVIRMLHDDDHRPVLAKSFTQWLESYAYQWEKGDFNYVEGCFIY